MVIALPTSKTKSESEKLNLTSATPDGNVNKTELEKKLEEILENIEGVGTVKVMLMTGNGQGLYNAEDTKVTGVLIVAKGAGNSVTVQKIQEAVMALFQIDAHKIRIMRMK